MLVAGTGAGSGSGERALYRDKNSHDYLETIRENEGMKNVISIKGI